MSISTESLARASGLHPWRTVAAWVGAMVVAFVLMGAFFETALTTDDYFTNEPESERALRLMEEREFRVAPKPSDIVIVQSDTHSTDQPEFRAFVEALDTKLAALGESVVSPGPSYLTLGDAQVSPNRDATFIPLFSVRDIHRVDEVLRDAAKDPAFQVLVTGDKTFAMDFEEISKEDLEVELAIGMPAAMVILIVVFGALVAAFVPVIVALVSILVALGVTVLIGQAFIFSFFVTNMVFMMGLAVGVDYSLFIVSRFREERARGLDKIDALGVAGSTASRAVLFSGAIVVLSLLGMLVVPYTIFRSLGAGAIIVVIVSVLASLTLLPAVLGLLGDRVNAIRIPLVSRLSSAGGGETAGGFWDAVTRRVTKRPLVSLLVTAALLIAAAVSTFDLNPGFPGISTFPDGRQSKDGYELLQEKFSFGLISQALVVIDGDVNSQPVRNATDRLVETMRVNPVFGDTNLLVNEAGNLAILSFPLNGDPSTAVVVGAIRALRSTDIPAAFKGVAADVLVGGEAAGNIDFFDLANTYLPFVLVFVLGLSFVMLTIVFRSLVVPIKAIIMNLLSVGVAYGLMVLVFQRGFLADELGFQQADAIAAWIPLFLFSVLFGLSMDYHVFLLSRIRERFDKTGDNTEAVAYGLRTTAGIITGAALIMVAVFTGFAMGQLVMFQQVGFGLAVAVFLDATIVRSVLVPSTMQLLGDRNWYLPSFLGWLPELRVEGGESERAAVAAD